MLICGFFFALFLLIFFRKQHFQGLSSDFFSLVAINPNPKNINEFKRGENEHKACLK